MANLVPNILLRSLKRQKYHFVGKHSAVKRCKWFYESLVGDRACYKQKFYGISSHRCIQMTPSLYYCTQQCLFCWRAQSGDLQIGWDEMQLPTWDYPDEIVDGILEAQNKILSGYAGNPKTIPEKFQEALSPKHVAISLTGEPTLYQRLNDLLDTLHKRKLTTFLVTNGTLPAQVSMLEQEPTQFYLSVCAPNKQIFKKVCRPQIEKAWTKLNETMQLLPSLSCPTAIRITLVEGYNMQDVNGYAKSIEKAQPTYIEAKAYMHIGFSGLRLGFDNMPEHKEVVNFANELVDKTGYKIINQSVQSRVVLLSKRKNPIRFDSE